MRVITGTARSTPLKAPKGLETRPTLDQVKEGLFSAIQFDVPGARALDLFAGSGQLGIEALSRGAARAKILPKRGWRRARRSCGWTTWRTSPPAGSSSTSSSSTRLMRRFFWKMH